MLSRDGAGSTCIDAPGGGGEKACAGGAASDQPVAMAVPTDASSRSRRVLPPTSLHFHPSLRPCRRLAGGLWLAAGWAGAGADAALDDARAGAACALTLQTARNAIILGVCCGLGCAVVGWVVWRCEPTAYDNPTAKCVWCVCGGWRELVALALLAEASVVPHGGDEF